MADQAGRAGRTTAAILTITLSAGLTRAAESPSPQGTSAAPAILGLDHIPLAVNDLEAAAKRFRQLGFTLKPGRPHANGIRNQHIKFADGTEIELITAPAARDELTTRYVNHLKGGDGPAFVSFFAPDMDRAATRLDAWRKPYRREGGLLTFLEGDLLRYIFLGPRNASPPDRPAYFSHANSAEGLTGVWIAAPDAGPEGALLGSLGVAVASRIVYAPNPVRARVADLPEGEIVFLPGERQLVRGRRVIGATLRTRDLEAVRRVLHRAHLDAPKPVRTGAGRSLFLPPVVAHGMWLEFREMPSAGKSRVRVSDVATPFEPLTCRINGRRESGVIPARGEARCSCEHEVSLRRWARPPPTGAPISN